MITSPSPKDGSCMLEKDINKILNEQIDLAKKGDPKARKYLKGIKKNLKPKMRYVNMWN